MTHDRFLAARSRSPASIGRAGGGGTPRTFTTEQLFEDDLEVWIQHAGDTYRLRITKTGKLILNK